MKPSNALPQNLAQLNATQVGTQIEAHANRGTDSMRDQEREGEIQVFIDDKECYAKAGEALLYVARRHGIAIPTLCDLKKLTPTGACRMCVVEEENGNVIASCKSFVTKPLRIYTNTKKIQKYRNQIMSFLCINHPLECGVCDKSGECELQDKVLESKVAIQPFFAIQKQNDYVHFHNKVYNESLCIMCERCARTCNEYVGNSVLHVLAGGFHSKIGVDFNAYCEDCDECVSVCPTGAMFSSRFTYTSNAWELEKNHSHCLHCSLHCSLHYEVKHNIDSKKEVYRVKNEAHTSQLCHAGRHNFLRDNRIQTLYNANEKPLLPTFSLEKALDSIEAIRLGTNITNEEAYLANLLAQKAGKKIYCNEALYYQRFCSILHTDGNTNTMEAIKKLDRKSVVLLLGSYLFDEMPVLRSDLAKAALKKGAKNVWISAVSEERFQSDVAITYEVGAELALCALLLHIFIEPLKERIQALKAECQEVECQEVECRGAEYKETPDSKAIDSKNARLLKLLQKTYTWLQEQDMEYLMAESNISEQEIQNLRDLCYYQKPLENGSIESADIKILIGQDFYLSPHYEALAHILATLSHCTLGTCEAITLCYDNIHAISALCDISHDNGGHNVLGIRTNGIYTLAPKEYGHVDSIHGIQHERKGHISIAPLQFMEGSYIDIYHNVAKLYPSFYDENVYSSHADSISCDMLDICAEYLDLHEEYIVDITKKLPFIESHIAEDNGMDFDSLCFQVAKDFHIKQIETSGFAYPEITLCEGSGIFIYKAALSGNLSFYRNEYYHLLTDNGVPLHGILKVSKQFCIATKLQDNVVVRLQIGGVLLYVRVIQASFMRGMVAVLASDYIVDSNKYFDYKSVE